MILLLQEEPQNKQMRDLETKARFDAVNETIGKYKKNRDPRRDIDADQSQGSPKTQPEGNMDLLSKLIFCFHAY